MQDDASTMRSSCESEGAEAGGLKRDPPEATLEAQAPERKRRRRRGIKDPRLSLNDDMMQLVIPYLAKTSVRHVFLLRMVNWDLHAMIADAHDLWVSMYRTWEKERFKTQSVYNRSIGHDFAVRCLQAMPRWMVKFYERGTRWPPPRMHPALPTPFARAVVGNNWREEGVPNEMRPSFERYARKVLCLWHIGCCGMCGARQGKQRAIWTLGMRVCRACWLQNVVSHRSLLHEYGLHLSKPLEPGGRRLHELIRHRVFYIRNFMPPSGREKFTQALIDFPADHSTLNLWLFWRPHLERIVDLGARRAQYQEKLAAATTLATVFQRAYALQLRQTYAEKQRNVQYKRICQLRHNEIRRQMQVKRFSDELDRHGNENLSDSIVNYADCLPTPGDIFPIRYVGE